LNEIDFATDGQTLAIYSGYLPRPLTVDSRTKAALEHQL